MCEFTSGEAEAAGSTSELRTLAYEAITNRCIGKIREINTEHRFIAE